MLIASRLHACRRLALGVAAIGLTTLVLPGAKSAAQTAESPVQLTLAAPLSSEWTVGQPIVVEATISADSLVSGRLTAALADQIGSTTIQRDIEVAGGAAERMLLVIPTPAFDPGRLEVVVEVRDGDTALASDKLAFNRAIDNDVTGVLPRLRAQMPDLPGRVTLEPDVRRSLVTAVPVDVLDLGPGALGQLNTLAGASADLANLSPQGRQALLAWVNAGGRLLIDDTGDLSSLPPQWRPGPAGYALAGRGEVRLTDGAAAAGKWKSILLPSELSANDAGFGINEMFVDPRSSLARRAGVNLPSLSGILTLLGIYAVAVGPVLYLVLRAIKRLSLAWLVVPALALLVGGVVVTAGAWRRGGDPVANVIRDGFPGGSSTSSETLLLTRSGGKVAVSAPTGWTPTETNGFFGEDASQVSKRTASLRDGRPVIEAELEAGQVAILRADGVSDAPTLEVTATATGRREVTGMVTNPGTSTVFAVAVFATDNAAVVGELKPGETKPFTLSNVAAGAFQQNSLADRVWSDPAMGIGLQAFDAGASPAESNTADFGVWGAFAAKQQNGLYPSGMVRAAGWRRSQDTELQSSRPVKATELVTSVAPIGVGDGKFDQLSARVALITSPWNGGNVNADGTAKAVTLMRLPPEAASRTLQVVASGVKSIELWNGTEWQEVEERDSNRFPVPQAVSRTGAVLVRTDVNVNNGPFGIVSAGIEEVR